ncbi:hypothetical protein IKE19_01090 [Candidatus Saccharibacteria bacterium]|nr:hypothetical protein [Candidatus Saccharibacteria bacterium]
MKRSTLLLFAKCSAVFLWLSLLIKTDSYYSIYLLVGIISVVTIFKNQNIKSNHVRLDYIFAGFFSLAVTLANYSLFSQIAEPGGTYIIAAIVFFILTFISGIIVFQNILSATKRISVQATKKFTDSPRKIFLTSFLIFFIIDLAILFICCYPGTLTSDSIDEIGQILSGTYSNHHPFYYTILIYPFIQIGTNLFHDINIGIAMFNIFQITIISLAFSYSISTLYRIGISKKILYPLAIFLAILPYNIVYSFTIWKDVLFGAFFLIFTVSLYRYFQNFCSDKKSKIINLLIISFSGLAICLFRSNALLAIFVSVLVFFIIFKRRYLKLGIILIIIVIAAFVLKRPVLQSANVTQPDTIESLSIPSQQITRVLKYNLNQISEQDIELINNVANVNDLAEAYSPDIQDPIKNIIRKGNQSYIKEHLADFISLYIRLGIQHPVQYAKAWIDQTRGYWNGGYDYWIWRNSIQSNDYDIERRSDSLLSNIFNRYLEFYPKIPFLQPLVSIGLVVWLLFILLYRTIIDKNKNNLFLLVPIFAIWATLLIATPVFSEFRYVYFMFTTTPFLALAIFAKTPKQSLLVKRKKYEKR